MATPRGSLAARLSTRPRSGSSSLPTATGKTVVCTHCAGHVQVGEKAMSVFCTHCKKRLILENYKVKTYKAVREFTTCGDIVVERKGSVAAKVRAENITVKGRIRGDIQARSKVEVAKSGDIHGDIHAPRLVVHLGGTIQGFCRIEPKPSQQP